jgi:hypothetical protein
MHPHYQQKGSNFVPILAKKKRHKAQPEEMDTTENVFRTASKQPSLHQSSAPLMLTFDLCIRGSDRTNESHVKGSRVDLTRKNSAALAECSLHYTNDASAESKNQAEKLLQASSHRMKPGSS